VELEPAYTNASHSRCIHPDKYCCFRGAPLDAISVLRKEACVSRRVQHFEVTERSRAQTPVVSPQTPPVGGNHAPIWQNCGFYDRPIAHENAVHSLEHGAVWITCRANLPQKEVEALHQLARRQPYLLVGPLPDGPAPVAASAWGHQLQLESIRDPRLGQSSVHSGSVPRHSSVVDRVRKG
jgi:hypothetical protein